MLLASPHAVVSIKKFDLGYFITENQIRSGRHKVVDDSHINEYITMHFKAKTHKMFVNFSCDQKSIINYLYNIMSIKIVKTCRMS